MSFRLRVDAEKWFRHISGQPPFNTKFDVYYLCLLLGLAGRRTSESSTQQPKSNFVDNFVTDYKPFSLLILGLLLRAEVVHYGYDLDEKMEVMKVLKELATPQGVSGEGVLKLNRYASGGFDILLDKFGKEPYSAEEFFTSYVDILQEVVAQEPAWYPIHPMRER